MAQKKRVVTPLEEQVLKAIMGDAKTKRVVGRVFITSEVVKTNKEAGALSTLSKKGFLTLGAKDGTKTVSVTEAGFTAAKSVGVA